MVPMREGNLHKETIINKIKGGRLRLGGGHYHYPSKVNGNQSVQGQKHSCREYAVVIMIQTWSTSCRQNIFQCCKS